MGWIENLATGEVLGERYEREEVFANRGRYPDPYSEPFYPSHLRPKRTPAQIARSNAFIELQGVLMALRAGNMAKAHIWLGRYAKLMNEAHALDEAIQKKRGKA